MLCSKSLVLFCLFFFITPCLAAPKAHYYYEKDYQKTWCSAHCGQQEVILPDKTRVDCLTDTHAIEFDFAHKWAESIGQALYYAQATNKKAGIVLIVENAQKEQKYLDRVKAVAEKYDITVWVMTPDKMK